MSKPITISNDNFDTEVTQSDLPVLIDFWAEWCGPCKMIAPTIEEIAEEYSGKLKVGKLDVDNNSEIAAKYGIRSIPSLLIFVDGNVKDMIIGAVPKSNIVKKLESIIG